MIGPNSAKRLILKTLVLAAWSSLVQCVRRGGQMGCYNLAAMGAAEMPKFLQGVLLSEKPLYCPLYRCLLDSNCSKQRT